jgi:hypothetical protein
LTKWNKDVTIEDLLDGTCDEEDKNLDDNKK